MIPEFAFIAGILAAVLHVITGPDHLAAITPFVIESKKKHGILVCPAFRVYSGVALIFCYLCYLKVPIMVTFEGRLIRDLRLKI